MAQTLEYPRDEYLLNKNISIANLEVMCRADKEGHVALLMTSPEMAVHYPDIPTTWMRFSDVSRCFADNELLHSELNRLNAFYFANMCHTARGIPSAVFSRCDLPQLSALRNKACNIEFTKGDDDVVMDETTSGSPLSVSVVRVCL